MTFTPDADNPATVVTGQTALATWANSRTHGIYNVLDFGAVGDGSTNDSTAIQNCIDAAKAFGGAVYFPAGTYHVTKSLDCTFADNPTANLRVFGAGKYTSIITAELDEEYPVLDFTGNTHGVLEALGVYSNSVTSKATAILLSAKPNSGGSRGNGVVAIDCHLELTVEGNPYADTGVVFYNTDLGKIIRCAVYGPSGATLGLGKSSGVTSKFQTIPSTGDSTIFIVENSTFVASSGPALEYTGGAAISIRDTYCALVGDGSAAVVKVSSTTVNSGNAIYAHDLRTENQSSATGVAAIYFAEQSRNGILFATLETDSTGAMLEVASGKTISMYFMSVSGGGTTKIFGGNPVVSNCHIIALDNGGDIGDLAATSWGNTFGGNITAASIYAQLGAASGNHVGYNSLTYRSMYELLVPPTRVTSALRPMGNISVAGVGTTAYTGGSGEQLVQTYTFPGAALGAWSGSLSLPAAEIVIVGYAEASSGASGRIRVELKQGASDVDVLDTSTNIPAGAADGLRLTVRIQCVGGTASRAYAEFAIDTATRYEKQKWTNTQADIVLNADFALNIYVTNSGNSPYFFEVREVRLI